MRKTRTINGKIYADKVLHSDIIEVPITEDMITIAYQKAEVARNFNNTFMPFERRRQGYLGEEVFHKVFPNATPSKGSYDYDFTMNGKTWEIKTKVISYPPKLHYQCSVYGYNPNQQSDLIAFVYIQKSKVPKMAWLLGYTTKDLFDKNCFFVPKGSELQYGQKARTDTWNIYVNQLMPVRNFL